MGLFELIAYARVRWTFDVDMTNHDITNVNLVSGNVTITGGTIDNTPIGGTTPAAIIGTTIDATTTFTFSDDTTTNTAPVRTATLVVAANDSLAKSKAQADYVCDGTADDVQIQAGIDALPVGGGKVLLSEGNYTINENDGNGYCIAILSNVTLAGQGHSALKLDDNQDCHMIVNSDQVGGNTNINIIDIELNGNIDNQTQVVGSYGIYLKNCTYSSVERCHIHHVVQYGIQPELCTHSRFNNNILNDVGNAAIGDGDGIEITNSSDCIIANNICKDNYQTGIEIEESQRIVTIGNSIYDCIFGIELDNEETAVHNNLIKGNIIHSAVRGICCQYGTSGTQIIGNYIYMASDADGNNLGIYFDQGAAWYDFNDKAISIIGNYIYGKNIHFSHGIRIRGKPGHEFTEMLITNNYINNVGSYSIDLVYVDKSLISNNFVTDGRAYGILLTDSDSNMIANNKFYNCNGDGIRIASGVENHIRNNDCRGNTNAIWLDPSVASQTFLYRQHSDHFQDCRAFAVSYVHAAITGTGVEQEITTAITNPDVPRNVTIWNDANSTGDVTIEGVDAKGNSVSEAITITTGGLVVGDVAFATVSKIIIPATVANPDVIKVGIGNILGLSNIVYETGDIYKVKVNNVDRTGEFNMAADVDTDYDTLNMSSLAAGAIAAGDDITIWSRSNLNIIN